MKCPRCGADNPAGSLACTICGLSFTEGETMSLPAEGETSGMPIVTEALSRPRLAPIPPRPDSLTPTDPRLRIVAPPRRGSRVPLLALPLGFVCGLLAIVGGYAAAANSEGPWRAFVNPTVEVVSVRDVATPTAAPAGQPSATPAAGSNSSPAAASPTVGAGSSPTAGAAASPTAGAAASPTAGAAASPTSGAAASPTSGSGSAPSPTAPAATPTTAPPTPAPQPTTPARQLKNTPQSTYSTGETAWRQGAGLTLASTQAGIGTITNPTARLTANFSFTNETGEPLNFTLNSGSFRVIVKGDSWRATSISSTAVSTEDGQTRNVTVTFTATGNLLQYQDVSTVQIIVDKFGPVEGVTFNARFR